MKTNISLYIILLCGIILLSVSCRNDESERKVTEYVNPFIGTGGHGHCFPGVAHPFGGIQLSPDNPRECPNWTSDYHYDDSIIASFSHTHLSGNKMDDLRDLRLLPTLSRPEKGVKAKAYIHSCRAAFSHENEYAEPGYYRVKFNNGIVTELAATERCGMHYYQYPENSIKGLTIDLTPVCNLDYTIETFIKKINNRKIEGYRKSRGYTKDQRIYFVMEFSQDITILAGKDSLTSLENGQKFKADACYAWVDFGDQTNKVLVKVSISSANCEGASANLEKELPHWSFDKVKRDCKAAWRRELSKIKVESNDQNALTIFYTALYHAYAAPYIYSDVNGNYKGPDGEIHSCKDIQYTAFSLNNMFRAVYPLFTITQRRKVTDMINSMLRNYDAIGVLPTHELMGYAYGIHNIMIDPIAASVIAEAYLNGIRGFDVEKAYESIKKTALASSRTLERTWEHAYSEWCVAQMAKALNKEDDYLYFLNRSKNYIHISDPNERNARHYTGFVPHDMNGLIALHGGEKSLAKKLDSLFTIVGQQKGHDIFNGYIHYYEHDSPDSHHIAYLYNYVGEPYKTQYHVDRIRRELYNNSPEGLCGYEASGQLSAWYVFSAMGFYPVNPVECKYQLGTPLFDKVTIKLGSEKEFTIIANREKEDHIFVKEVFLNNEKLDRTWITHDEIMKGGKLEFVLEEGNKQLLGVK
ncbi:GH92 family glycosyl hydrolase [Odoribacter sp. OttesenSCG-928-J03]|nr:GH92 family glycosyl hydrolase [Odoribacter sp. OttesenSCG-928-J03]